VPAPAVQIAGAALHTQLAAPAAPWQVSLAVQVAAVPLTKKQAPSWAQVETVLPVQNGPTVLQVEAAHTQRPVPELHVECALQAVVTLTKKQLLLSWAQ